MDKYIYIYISNRWFFFVLRETYILIFLQIISVYKFLIPTFKLRFSFSELNFHDIQIFLNNFNALNNQNHIIYINDVGKV